MSHRLRTLLIIMASALALVGYAIFFLCSEKAENVAIHAFSTTIPLGMSRNQVTQSWKAACAEHKNWTYWSDATTHGSSVVCVESPLVFGASNHVVYIVFDHDAVAAVLVRTLDTKTQWPGDAPEDRVADSSLKILKDF